MRLEATSSGTSPAGALILRTAGTGGVVTLTAWECKQHGLLILTGDPCPECPDYA